MGDNQPGAPSDADAPRARTDERLQRLAEALRVPDAPRRGRYSFSRRVAAITLVTVTSVLVLAAVALTAIDPAVEANDRLTTHVGPPLRLLTQTSRNVERAQEEFVRAIEATGSARNDHIAESQRLANRAAARWSRYKQIALGTRLEKRLQAEFDDLRRESQGMGATVFSLAVDPDSEAFHTAFHEQEALVAGSLGALAAIRQRVYHDALLDGIDGTKDDLGAAQLWIGGVALLIVLAVLVASVVVYRTARRQEAALAADDQQRRLEERRANLENQLQRGLEMEPTEPATYEVIEAAVAVVRPGAPVELLLADSSRAHFRRAFRTGPDVPGGGCDVPSPADCPAAISGQSRVFLSGDRLDACPYLRHRSDGPRSAACIPVNITGSSSGVIHTTGPECEVPDPNVMAELELVARKAGERIGYLRVLARSEMQAKVDPLTGLLNRRSIDDAARELLERGEPFAVAFADLDHFKDLNDTYGHEIGDRALRLFGRVLRDTVRPDDVVGRFGGEEFVVLLPGTTVHDARAVADRIRERLREALSGATVPPFTVSIGLTAWEPSEELAETIGRADNAMLHAKRDGRDRVMVVADVTGSEVAVPSVPTAAPAAGASGATEASDAGEAPSAADPMEPSAAS